MEDNERIRHRAHQIWESEGRPEGRAAQHWAQAQDELGGGVPGDDALPDGQGDDPLPELSADASLADSSQADGRIILAGQGGTSGGPDEAEEALGTPAVPDAREGR